MDRTPRDFQPEGSPFSRQPYCYSGGNKDATWRKQSEKFVSVSETGIETPRIRFSRDVLRANVLAVKDFLDDLSVTRIAKETSSLGNSLWRKVPKALIAKLLRRYDSHPSKYVISGC